MAFDSDDLLRVAGELISAASPSSSHIARSISTSYYAIFQHLIFETSNLIVGPHTSGLSRATDHLQRSLSHGDLQRRCKELKKRKFDFPVEIVEYAEAVVELQEVRHKADYARNVIFSKRDAEMRLDLAREAISGFDRLEARHKRAFIIWANFDRRAF